jgi:hypothetical protein
MLTLDKSHKDADEAGSYDPVVPEHELRVSMKHTSQWNLQKDSELVEVIAAYCQEINQEMYNVSANSINPSVSQLSKYPFLQKVVIIAYENTCQ